MSRTTTLPRLKHEARGKAPRGGSSIPLVDLTTQHRLLRPELETAIDRVLSTASFIQGDDVRQFEQEFAAYCEAKHAVGVSSGTEALYLALLALGAGRGDEVITTPFTFFATAEAISQTGALPVFVDVDPRTLNMDPAELEDAITDATVGVIPVHLYGHPAAMDPIMNVARRHRLWVVEDAAQAHGARYKGRRVGSIADAGCFSFYPGKNLGAIGDAGAVVTNDDALADKLRLLRDHGRRDKYEHLIVGTNGRLDTLQAAVLRIKLRCLEGWNNRRRELAAAYRDRLWESGLELPSPMEDVEPVYHLFVIQTGQRDQLQEVLQEQGISTGVHYPIPLHLQPAYRSLEYYRGDFPEAERAAREVLSLPMYPELTVEQVTFIADAVKAALKDKADDWS